MCFGTAVEVAVLVDEAIQQHPPRSMYEHWGESAVSNPPPVQTKNHKQLETLFEAVDLDRPAVNFDRPTVNFI